MKLTEELLKEEIEKVMSEGFADFFRGRKRGPTGKGDTPGGAGQQVTFKDQPTPEEEMAAQQMAAKGREDARAKKLQPIYDKNRESGLSKADAMGMDSTKEPVQGDLDRLVDKARYKKNFYYDLTKMVMDKLSLTGDQANSLMKGIQARTGDLKTMKQIVARLKQTDEQGLKAAIVDARKIQTESITLSSNDIRKMIQEEIFNIKKGNNG
jgi:hypothetical protein